MPDVNYVAEPIIEIDGQPAPEKLLEDILEISVEENLNKPGTFTLVINNDYFSGRSQDRSWQHASLFEIGKAIKIGFISSTSQAREFAEGKKGYILEGEITGIECNFTSDSQAPMIIRGYDVSHRLSRGRYNRSFQNMTDTDIVKKIAGEVGIPTGTIDDTGGPYGYGDIGGSDGYVFQQNQTNLEFLRERANRHGFELFVKEGKLNFRKPKVENSVELGWLKELHSFEVRVNSDEQVKEVEVRGWDYSKKQPILETASKGQSFTKTSHGEGVKTSTSFKGQPPTPKMVVVDQPVSNASEAKKIAQALCDELAGEFVQADAKAEGNPEIRTGKTVKLKDMGKYAGEYYVTSCRHLFQERVYTTEFSVGGSRGETGIASVMSSSSTTKAAQTFLVGIVTDNKDPKGWGRVRVKFPTLTEDHASYWARVVAAGAGANRGFDCLPEINDEVLVAFEHGDMHRPYVIGGVWNGKDAPSEKVDDSVVGGKVRLRTFKTRTGHKLQCVEEDKGSSKKGVYVDTVAGHHVYMNDTEKFAEVKTNGGHQVRLDDKNKNILIQTSGGHKIEMSDTSKTITISATQKIEMTAPDSITLKSGSSSIEMSPASISIKSTVHKVELGAAGIAIDTPAQAQL
ncbi:MAG TPA: type IV secretion protein Rhs, partial [Cyanobacteria bacterium UBA9226]|nr:type IV secretion protein Rhs [Cyanobacteria bacterium UBA9226]